MKDRQDAKDAKGVVIVREPEAQRDDLARRVIGAAIEVHRHLGPGFHEAVYEQALAIEFRLRRISFERQPCVAVRYKGHEVGDGRPDFVVGDTHPVIVEIKAAAQLAAVHSAQVISYLKATQNPLGLLLNFKESTMRRGIRRVVFSQRHDRAGDVHKSHEATDSFVVPGCDSAVALQVVEEDFDSIA